MPTIEDFGEFDFTESIDELSLGCGFATFESLFSSSESSESTNSTEATPQSEPSTSQTVYKWVDETSEYYPLMKRAALAEMLDASEVELVRSRLKRRKNRPVEANLEGFEVDSKRTRNTLAARRYRERQRKDVEVLDARIRQVEQELRNAKQELKRWKTEALKWKEQVQKGQGREE